MAKREREKKRDGGNQQTAGGVQILFKAGEADQKPGRDQGFEEPDLYAEGRKVVFAWIRWRCRGYQDAE